DGDALRYHIPSGPPCKKGPCMKWRVIQRGHFQSLLTSACLGLATINPARAAITLSDNWSLQDIAKVPATDAGDTISKVGYTPAGGVSGAGWYKAAVPGTVLTSLVNDGVYPEPLYGENNRPEQIPESLCRTSYWYRTET